MSFETRADVVAAVVDRTLELCEVPAPPLDEADRAEIVARWWRADGLADVGIDATGNVWARVQRERADDGRPALVVAAHLDTVFDRSVKHGALRRRDRLTGPSVGDDSVAVASLAAAAVQAGDDAADVWLLATVGEEGRGDLRGVRAAIDASPAPIGALIAVEGNWLGRIGTTGVGSQRWRISVRGPGGHAWERADAPSAVHAACRAVAAVDDLDVADLGRTARNVGMIEGGEAINARAESATFEIDLRAEDPEDLTALVDRAERTILSELGADVGIDFETIGARPAGGIEPTHPLVVAAQDALERAGLAWRHVAGSTDANAAYAASIPAITVGVTTGAGEHTVDEYIDLPPLDRGIGALADTIARAAAFVVRAPAFTPIVQRKEMP